MFIKISNCFNDFKLLPVCIAIIKKNILYLLVIIIEACPSVFHLFAFI